MDREGSEQEIIAEKVLPKTIIEGVQKQSREIQQSLIRLINISRNEHHSCIFFLDKSARPLAWIFRQTWKGLAEKGLIPKEEPMPAIRFINIGREQDEKMFESDSTAMELAKRKYKVPDGRILIVDEYSETGKSLDKAEKVIHKLLPGRDILTNVALTSVPPWYGEGELIGVEEKTLGDEGEIEKGDRVWSYPLSGYENMDGIQPADRKKNLAFRQLLKSEIVDHIVSESIRRKDGSILLPDLSIGFKAE